MLCARTRIRPRQERQAPRSGVAARQLKPLRVGCRPCGDFAFGLIVFRDGERWRRGFGDRLTVAEGASPNLRFTDLRVEPGGQVDVGAGYAAERRAGNHVWVQGGGVLRGAAALLLEGRLGRWRVARRLPLGGAR